MAATLQRLLEDGWPGGAWRSGDRDALPPGTLYSLKDAFLADDDRVVRRAGSAYKSNASSAAVMALWAGLLGHGEDRTVWTSSIGRMWYLDPADDASPLQVATGLTVGRCRPVAANGAVLFPQPTVPYFNGGASVGSGGAAWGGSVKAAYNANVFNTLDADAGLLVMAGAGSFGTNIEAGMIATPDVGASDYVTQAWVVVDATDPVVTLSGPMPLPGSPTWSFRPYLKSAVPGPACEAGGRVWTAVGNRVYFTYLGMIVNRVNDVGLDNVLTNFHAFPSKVLGLATMRDLVVVFTEDRVYAISNPSLELVDANGNVQQLVRVLNGELLLWGSGEGAVEWRGGLVVPCTDGCWMLDSVSAPVKISASDDDRWTTYAATGGYKPGQAAIVNGHYFMPVLDGSDAPVDMLVCRLTPTRSGRTGTWSSLRGNGGGGNIRCVDRRGYSNTAASAGLLYGGGIDGRIHSLNYFGQAASHKNDADGSTHQLEMQLRGWPTGRGVVNRLDHAEVRYELVKDGADAPTLRLSWTCDGTAQNDALDGGPSSGVAPTRYSTGNDTTAKDGRSVALTLTSVGPCASLKIKAVELFVRPSGRESDPGGLAV